MHFLCSIFTSPPTRKSCRLWCSVEKVW